MRDLLPNSKMNDNYCNCKCNINEEIAILTEKITCYLSKVQPGFIDSMNPIIEDVMYFKRLLSRKDIYTMKHSDLVGLYARAIACRLGLTGRQEKDLYIAGVLHDVGKLYIPNRILKKIGPLNYNEYQLIKKHPLYSHDLLAEYEAFSHILTAVTHHHEHYDGNGYPQKLRAEEIPFFSRILAVADAFEAMTSDRPYRKSSCIAQACTELKNKAGSQFDPDVVEAFLGSLHEHCRCPIRPFFLINKKM